MSSPTQKLYNNYTNSAGKEIQVNVNYLDPPRYYIYDKKTNAILGQNMPLDELNKFLKDNNYVLSVNDINNPNYNYKIKDNTGGRKSHRKRKSHRRRKSHRKRKSHRRRK